jgi:hypothetical protein
MRRRERRDERGSWYLLTGLVFGILMGLFYAWWIRPVSYTNTSPASLRADFKDQYRALIAAAYLANGDLVRAKARLDLLKDADVYRTLAEQAQHMLAEGSSAEDARALGLLAVELGQAPTAITLSPQVPSTPATRSVAPATPFVAPATPFVAAPAASETLPADTDPAVAVSAEPATLASTDELVEPTSSPEPTSTWTPPATPTPTEAPEALYTLISQDQVCDPALGEPLIQIQVQDASGEPVPGVEIVVSWEGGEESFFTGLKPELGLGYADYNMTPGVTYSLHLEQGGERVSDLAASECESTSGDQYWGSWLLTFAQQ